MPQFGFGAGTLFMLRTDVSGTTPIEIGGLQDCSAELSATTKEAYGGFQFPIAIARGKGKIDFKAKMVEIYGAAYANLFFGSAAVVTAAQLKQAYREGPTAIPATPFTVTVTNGATWVEDLGVINAATGQPLTALASGTPAAGQYVASAGGSYLFSSADHTSGISVQISYLFSYSTSGNLLTVSNPQMGLNPVFQAVFNVPYTAPTGVQNLLLKFNACVSSKLSFPSKLDDFMITEFDFSAFADSGNNILSLSTVD